MTIGDHDGAMRKICVIGGGRYFGKLLVQRLAEAATRSPSSTGAPPAHPPVSNTSSPTATTRRR